MSKIISVIGNGPSPVGKGWGERIDVSDKVIRLHDCQYQNRADYGRRYDIGVMPPWWQTAIKCTNRFAQSQWWLYHFGTVKELDITKRHEMFGRTVKFFDLSASNDMIRAHGKAPSGRRASASRGFAALVMASLTFPDATILAYGFDALFAGESVDNWPNPDAYKAMVAKDMTDCGVYHSTAVHHDAPLEKSLLPANVAQVI